jgi:hypothetical protein
VTCSKCITWYLDQDGDGFGAHSSNDKVGCDTAQPPDVNGHHYVKNNTDCDDTDGNAHPGQAKYFTTKSAGGTWDYNCDGTNEGAYATVLSGTTTCHNCGSTYCLSPLQVWGYECPGSNSCASVTQAYKGTFQTIVQCGQSGTLYHCSATGTETSTPSVVEPCR